MPLVPSKASVDNGHTRLGSCLDQIGAIRVRKVKKPPRGDGGGAPMLADRRKRPPGRPGGRLSRRAVAPSPRPASVCRVPRLLDESRQLRTRRSAEVDGCVCTGPAPFLPRLVSVAFSLPL